MKNIKNSERELFANIIKNNESVLHILSKRERQIIKLRYGLFDGVEHTQRYIGELFHLSDTRIAQLEAKGRYKVNQYIESQVFPK
jgi:RNA polymerase primary sigma factor